MTESSPSSMTPPPQSPGISWLHPSGGPPFCIITFTDTESFSINLASGSTSIVGVGPEGNLVTLVGPTTYTTKWSYNTSTYSYASTASSSWPKWYPFQYPIVSRLWNGYEQGLDAEADVQGDPSLSAAWSSYLSYARGSACSSDYSAFMKISPTTTMTSLLEDPSGGLVYSHITTTWADSCCGACDFQYQKVDLFYWPAEHPNNWCLFPNGSFNSNTYLQSGTTHAFASGQNGNAYSTGDDGFVYTSPSIYIKWTSLQAADKCGSLGPVTSATLAFSPGELSTIWGWGHQRVATGTSAAFNPADMPCGPGPPYNNDDPYPNPDLHYQPLFSPPNSRMDSLRSGWEGCTAVVGWNGWDPPRTLEAATAMVAPQTQADPKAVQTATAAPSPTAAALPLETGLHNDPATKSTDSDPKNESKDDPKAAKGDNSPLLMGFGAFVSPQASHTASKSVMESASTPVPASSPQMYPTQPEQDPANNAAGLPGEPASNGASQPQDPAEPQHTPESHDPSSEQQHSHNDPITLGGWTFHPVNQAAQPTNSPQANPGTGTGDSSAPSAPQNNNDSPEGSSSTGSDDPAASMPEGSTGSEEQNKGNAQQPGTLDKSPGQDSTPSSGIPAYHQSPPPTVYHIADETVTQGGAAITISGTPISLGLSYAIIGTQTLNMPSANLPPSPTMPPPNSQILTLAGEVCTPNPTGFSIGSIAILPNAPAVTISGTPISLASSQLVIGTSVLRLPQPSEPPTGIVTIGGEIINVDANDIVVAGQTITPGAPGITASGTYISLGSSQIIVGSVTKTFAPATNEDTNSATSTGIGGMIMQGFGSAAAPTETAAGSGGGAGPSNGTDTGVVPFMGAASSSQRGIWALMCLASGLVAWELWF